MWTPPPQGTGKKQENNGKFEKSGQGYGHLRTKQHRGTFSQLPARPPLYGKDECRKRRLRHHHQHVRLHCPAARDPHLRHGDHILPLCQQGRRGCAARLLHHPVDGGGHERALRGAHTGVHPAREHLHGLCQPPQLRLGDGRHGGDRRLPVHSLRLPPLPEAPHQVCRPEAVVHHTEHHAQPSLLCRARRNRGGLRLLHQPRLHGVDHVLLLEGVAWLRSRFRPRIGTAHALLLMADTHLRHCRHPQSDGGQDSLPLFI